jgi:SAM-dependent methyltransferase
MARIEAFEKFADAYEEWFEKNEWAYKSELEAVRRLLPTSGEGLEVGIGTGRFAIPLGIKSGVEPSPKMAEIARSKGLSVVDGVCEALPFDDGSFDFILLVTTICFVDDAAKCLSEIFRALRKNGSVVIGFIDRESELGKLYQAKKDKSKFYGEATFFTADEIAVLMENAGFKHIQSRQTIFRPLPEIKALEPIEDGHGQGAFVVMKGIKD